MGASTVLGPGDRASFYRLLRDGCSAEPRELKLLYRASRDGFYAANFHSKCDNVGATITLVRVGNISSSTGQQLHEVTEVSSATESIVGGFSDVSWSSEQPYKDSEAAFIFMLRDDTGHSTASHAHATRWAINEEIWHTDTRLKAVHCNQKGGPCFGVGELNVNLKTSHRSSAKNFTADSSYNQGYSAGYNQGFKDRYNTFFGNKSTITCKAASTYAVPRTSREAYNRLDGRSVVDVEVFLVESYHQSPSFTTPRCKTPKTSSDEDDGMDGCEASIFECVRRERASLQRAKGELAQINVRLDTTVQTMTELYGPRVTGEPDAVVELNVRGAPMSTLFSTLQGCPDSGLAVMFSKRWQTSKKNVDAEGRRQLDCDPACFAKVLEMLRSKQRVVSAGASSSDARGETITTMAKTKSTDIPRPYVVVDAAERECFEELVNKYFPGHEDFIIKSVSFSSGH